MVGAEAGEKEKTGKKEHQRTGFSCFTAEPDKSYLFKTQEGNWSESHTSLMVPPTWLGLHIAHSSLPNMVCPHILSAASDMSSKGHYSLRCWNL